MARSPPRKAARGNFGRAAKMHEARLEMEAAGVEDASFPPRNCAHVGCSGWFYWKWRGLFYPVDMPTGAWFDHYAEHFDTVEINTSFYSWPTVTNVKSWKRQPGNRKFLYTVKVCDLITHVEKFKSAKALVKDFGMIADILGSGWAVYRQPDYLK